jgi:hypothetical protein
MHDRIDEGQLALIKALALETLGRPEDVMR